MHNMRMYMHHTLAKEGPWAVHLTVTLGQGWAVTELGIAAKGQKRIVVYAVTEHQEITAPNCCTIVLPAAPSLHCVFIHQGLRPITLKGINYHSY